MKSELQIDSYTKFILTIIALCLMWICLRNAIVFPKLYGSNSDLIDVRIRAIERIPDQNWDPIMIEGINSLPVEVRNIIAIPVEVKNAPLPVDVKSVDVKRALVPIEVKK